MSMAKGHDDSAAGFVQFAATTIAGLAEASLWMDTLKTSCHRGEG